MFLFVCNDFVLPCNERVTTSFSLHWAACLCLEDRTLMWMLRCTPKVMQHFPKQQSQHIFMMAEKALSASLHNHSNYFRSLEACFRQHFKAEKVHLHINISKAFLFFSCLLSTYNILPRKLWFYKSDFIAYVKHFFHFNTAMHGNSKVILLKLYFLLGFFQHRIPTYQFCKRNPLPCVAYSIVITVFDNFSSQETTFLYD